MRKSTCRYVINAVGKSGQIYMSHCEDKHTLNKWIAEHQDQLIMSELKITDHKPNFFVKWFRK